MKCTCKSPRGNDHDDEECCIIIIQLFSLHIIYSLKDFSLQSIFFNKNFLRYGKGEEKEFFKNYKVESCNC